MFVPFIYGTISHSYYYLIRQCSNIQQRKLDSYGNVITYSQHLTKLFKMILWWEDK